MKVPDNAHLHSSDMARDRIAFRVARAFAGWPWRSHKAGLRYGQELKAPHRDWPRSPRLIGSVASNRNRDHEDGSDAVSDWPLLMPFSTCQGPLGSACHGGGVGMGFRNTLA
jgi:urocanate hydratase